MSGESIKVSEAGADIFLNNSRVLLICLVLSLVYGFGALFVLTWNASVGGVFIGNLIKQKMVSPTTTGAFFHFQATSAGLLSYLPHGLLEMGAYFIAALAGGIISRAIVHHDYRSSSFRVIVLDASYLLLISVVVLLIAAIVEVVFTPYIVSFFAI